MPAELLIIAFVFVVLIYFIVRFVYQAQRDVHVDRVDLASRKTSVSVVGGIWVCMAAIMGGGAFVILLATYILNEPTPYPYARGIAVVQFALAAASIFVAFMFRQGRPWSRRALEICSWLILIYAVVATLLVCNAFPNPLIPFASISPIVAILFASIVYLRRPKIRDVFRPQSRA